MIKMRLMVDVYGCLKVYGASNTTKYLLRTTEKGNTKHKFSEEFALV